MSQRKEKVSERIRQEVSTILHDEIKDPRVTVVTITRVEVASDLSFAKIFYSVLGDAAKEKAAKEGLESALKYVRKLLGERLTMRYTPDLSFKIDKTLEYQRRIGQIFEQIEEERKEKQGEDNEPEENTGEN